MFTTEDIQKALDFRFLSGADWGMGCFFEDYILLAGVAVMLRPKKILEIGTSNGLGSIVLAKASSFLSEPAHVTSVDISMKDARKNLHLVEGIERQITFIEGPTDHVLPKLKADGSWFDFIFIDGDHKYEQVKYDWLNCISLSTTFAFHDTTQFMGLQQLMREIRSENIYDVFQFVSPPGHRYASGPVKEHFSTGISLVQNRKNLWDLPYQADCGHNYYLLPGHAE